MENRPWFVVGVRRIFWTDPYIWGKCFLLCSCSRTPTGRGKPRARARARVRAPREGRAPRYLQHTYCVLLRTHIAPKTRIARAPELVRVQGPVLTSHRLGAWAVTREDPSGFA